MDGRTLGELLPPSFLALSGLLPYAYPMSKLFAFIEHLVSEGFFGTLTLSFQNGKLCNIKVERNLKPSDL